MIECLHTTLNKISQATHAVCEFSNLDATDHDLQLGDAPRLENSSTAKVRSLTKQCTIYDRLQSIRVDAAFVASVQECFGFPVAVNERCGRWYVRPEHISTSVYFKSTDGHTDHCKFSLRRLNLHTVPLICRWNGMIIVDSTRRGKRMPDAISKTIPIWCCVITRVVNQVMQKGWDVENLRLHTPHTTVSMSEHEHVSSSIDSFVEALLKTNIDMTILGLLDKPLRPLWITPASKLQHDPKRFSDTDYYPLVLVTASRAVPDGVDRQHGFTYVQGAADDEEMWSLGLDPGEFWDQQAKLLGSGPKHCQMSLENRNLKVDTVRHSDQSTISRIRNTAIYLGNHVVAQDLSKYLVIDLSETRQFSQVRQYEHIPIKGGKKGAGQLHSTFRILETYLRADLRYMESILLIDDEDCKTKASIVALFVLLVFYNKDDQAKDSIDPVRVDKNMVRNRLVTLVNTRPGLNPSRASLKSLNEYLMSGQYRLSR